MPHIIVEFSDNISETIITESFIHGIHQLLSVSLPADIGSCKSRCIKYDKFLLGADLFKEKGAFMHVTVKIMKGRSKETLHAASQALSDYLQDFFKNSMQHNRPLSKLAPVRQAQEVHGAQNHNVLNVHEDLSAGTTQQLSTGVEFGKRADVHISIEIVELSDHYAKCNTT